MLRMISVLAIVVLVLGSCLFGKQYGSEEFDQLLDERTNTILRYATRVQPLWDGEQTFTARRELISDTHDYLLVQTFVLPHDRVSQEFLDLFAERAKHGVDVRFIYDRIGSIMNNPFFLARLNEQPFDVKCHLALWGGRIRPGKLWHEKIIVSDGNTAIVGGMHFNEINLDRERLWYELPAHRDLDILLEGSIVKDIEQSFLENWEILGGDRGLPAVHANNPVHDSSGTKVPMRFVTQKPVVHEELWINNLYVEAIEASRESIYLESPFFSPPQDIINALVAAASRGVKIRILLNSFWTLDLFYRYPFTVAYYPIFLREGIEIYEMRTTMTHAKIAVFDGVYNIVGSYNLDIRSAYWDTECVVAFFCPEFAEELTAWFEEGLEDSRRVRMLFW